MLEAPYMPSRLKAGSTLLLGKLHKFVESLKHNTDKFRFTTAAIAKQAIIIRDPTIRGLPVSITVPKRFFQKTVEVSPRDTIETGSAAYSRYTSNPNNREYRNRVSSNNDGSDVTASTAANNDNLSYSPQDARSDLHKKKKGKQPQQSSIAAGSPEARKATPKRRQESPMKDKYAGSAEAVQGNAIAEATKADDHVPVPDTATEILPVNEAQTNQSQVSEEIPSDTKKKLSPTAVQGGHAIDGTPGPVYVSGAADKAFSSTTDQQQHAVTKQLDSQLQQEVEPHIESIAKQNPIKQTMKVEDTAVELAPKASLESEDVASNDELNNNTSFHWAAEPQSELEANMELGAGSGTANQGSTSLAPKAVTATDDLPPTPSVPIAKIAPADIIVLSEDIVVPAAAGIEPSISKMKAITMPSGNSKAAEVSLATQLETVSSTTVSPAVEPARKGGAQHTESLHPFSKASKAQMRKEKEQKKKAQKKEKEQTERAKAAKAAASKPTAKSASAENGRITKVDDIAAEDRISNETKPVVKVEPTGMDPPPSADNGSSASTQEANAVNASVNKPAPAAMVSKEARDSRDKPGKRKDKNADTPVVNDAATAGNEDEDHGKGTISIPNEIGSVTNKKVKVDMPEDVLASGVQSSKQQETNDTSSAAKEPGNGTAVTPAEGSTPSAKKKNKRKKKKTPLAWPDLEIRPKSPNPPWMGPIDMATDVQHYDGIINEACGGEEDSDFSWSDLPKMEDNLSSNEDEKQDGEGDEDGDGGEDMDAINKQIAELQTRQGKARVIDLGTQSNISSRDCIGSLERCSPQFPRY